MPYVLLSDEVFIEEVFELMVKLVMQNSEPIDMISGEISLDKLVSFLIVGSYLCLEGLCIYD